MTTAITKSITTDDKFDDNSDDNISLLGIAGYVLSDKLRFPDNTTAADHCRGAALSSRSTPPEGVVSLTKRHIVSAIDRLDDGKAAVLASAKPRLEPQRHTPAAAPPQ